MEEIHENVHVFVLLCSVKKHACFHVNFPNSTYFYPSFSPPPLPIGLPGIMIKVHSVLAQWSMTMNLSFFRWWSTMRRSRRN